MKQGKTSLYKGALVVVLGFLMQSCVSPGLSDKKAGEAAQYNAQLGAEYLQKNELEQARDKLEKALEQDQRNALAHVTYGQLQYRVENNRKARVHFKRAIELEPDQADHRNNYGVFLCQIKEYEAAEEQFAVAADNKFYKTPEFALDNAGVCMLDAERLDKAEGYLRKALQINPTFAKTYLHMAELLYKHERLTVADAYFQRYLSYGNDTPESLLLGIQINRDIGINTSDAQKSAQAEVYASKLLNDFPTSREAGEYLSRPLQQ